MAFTTKNTVEIVNGQYVYTFSQSTGQEPMSQAVLDSMSFAANNPDHGEEKPKKIVPVAPVAPVVSEIEALTEEEATPSVVPLSDNTNNAGPARNGNARNMWSSRPRATNGMTGLYSPYNNQ